METCDYCECRVQAVWLTTEDRLACDRCILDLADCPHCQRVILPGDGVSCYHKDCYCFDCASRRPACVRCSDPIFGDTLTCCNHCAKVAVFCHHCQCECSKGYFLDEVGPRCSACCTCRECEVRGPDVLDHKCPSCRNTRVMSLQDGMALYPAAYEFLREVMELTLERIPFLDISLEMPTCNPRVYPESLNQGRNIIGLHSSAGWIWVKSGRADHVSLLVLVHELAHAWQNENCPRQSDALTEGFAVWLEYNCALYLNYPEYAERQKQNPCPVYGGGLRSCLLWEEAVGWRQLLQDIRLSGDFPNWIKLGWWRGLAA